MEQSFIIADLLEKKIKNNISLAEEKQLQQWVNESQANAAFYSKMLKDHTLIEKLNDYELFNKEIAWKSIDKKLFKAKVIRLNFKKVLRYAAVLIPFVMLISGGIYWWNQQSYSFANIDETIKPFEQKATLILANGKTVNLQNKTTTNIEEGGVQLINQKDLLTYSINKEVKELKALVYNTLVTPKGGSYQLTMSDGTEVWLNANTSIKYPVQFTDSTREVFLEGEAFFDVQHNGKPFIVNTPETDIRVLGTSFNVSAYENEPYTSTTLVEGSVKLSTTQMEQVLKPNEQANVLKNKTDIQIKPVNTDLYTSWVRGKVEFEEESLEAVMRRLSRLYNFEYQFDNEAAKDYHFTARIDNSQPISTILKMLEMTTDVEFNLKDNTIIIH
jgi:ferric-dicitrate binding protein FerR (iron transport regulator)